MSNIEFILVNFNINPNKLTAYDRKWINESIIPFYEDNDRPYFPAEIEHKNLFTGEVRKINVKEALESLKAL